MKIGKWIYRAQSPIVFWGQHNEFYPYLTIVLRTPIARVWAGDPGEPPF